MPKFNQRRNPGHYAWHPPLSYTHPCSMQPFSLPNPYEDLLLKAVQVSRILASQFWGFRVAFHGLFWTNNADKTPQTPEAKGRSWRVFRDVTLWHVALDSSKIWDICGPQSPQMIWDCLVANTQTQFSKPPLTDTKLRHLSSTDLAKETSTKHLSLSNWARKILLTFEQRHWGPKNSRLQGQV